MNEFQNSRTRILEKKTADYISRFTIAIEELTPNDEYPYQVVSSTNVEPTGFGLGTNHKQLPTSSAPSKMPAANLTNAIQHAEKLFRWSKDREGFTPISEDA